MTGIPAPLDVHSLLSEQDFVRRLARSLVFEQDTVDDVVQEAWLAAAKNPPRQEASTRVWFARVLENLARRRARDRVRRQERERRAAAAESLPAVDAVLAREEQRQRVVAAVVALPEPYRGVVLARYFDGGEPAEIARQRGVPAATIRSQLKRALDLLRKKLDAEHGGDRRAWCLALAPLARPEPATGLLSSFLAMAGAWIVVKIVGVACVLGLLVWGLLSIGGGGGAEAEAPVEARKEVAAGASGQDQEPLPRTRVADATAAASAPSSAVAAAAAKADAGFRGRLLRQNGAPAAGEAVRFAGVEGLSLFADAGKDGVKIARGTATTAADGTFTVTGLMPNAFYAATLADGGKDQTLRMVPVAPGPDEVADLGDLRLVEKAAVTGRVVDPEGAPVAGAEVLCLDLPAAIGSLLPFARLVPEHGGFVTMPVPEPAELAGATRGGSGYGAISARTLFQDEGLEKRPGLATLLVESLPWLQAIWDTLPIAKARTAADGTFMVAARAAGLVLARRPQARPGAGGKPRIVLRAGETKQVGDVTLSRGEELAGRVLDAAGRPVAGAEVRVGVIAALGYRGAAFAEAPVHADAQGEFRVPGLGQERVLVAARSARQGRWHVLGPVDVQGDLEVRLPATTTLEVSICSRDGKPLPDARPRLFVGPSLHELRRAGVQQELPLEGRMNALADGRLAIGDLGPGVYTLRVEEPGTVMAEAMVVLPAQEPLAIRLEPCSPLRVVVRDPDGRPLPGASVYLQQSDEDGNDHAIMPTDYGLPRWSVVPHRAGETDSTGVLEARQRPAKAVVVHAFHPRFGVANALADERTTELVLALQRPGRDPRAPVRPGAAGGPEEVGHLPPGRFALRPAERAARARAGAAADGRDVRDSAASSRPSGTCTACASTTSPCRCTGSSRP
jgi:RNA polymerase sigma-70 factor (ECF subfamily)